MTAISKITALHSKLCLSAARRPRDGLCEFQRCKLRCRALDQRIHCHAHDVFECLIVKQADESLRVDSNDFRPNQSAVSSTSLTATSVSQRVVQDGVSQNV